MNAHDPVVINKPYQPLLPVGGNTSPSQNLMNKLADILPGRRIDLFKTDP